TLFTLDASILILVYIGVGGLASTAGSVLGVILLIAFNESLRFVGLPSQFVGPLQQAVYGLLLIGVMIFRRRGLVGGYDLRELGASHRPAGDEFWRGLRLRGRLDRNSAGEGDGLHRPQRGRQDDDHQHRLRLVPAEGGRNLRRRRAAHGRAALRHRPV